VDKVPGARQGCYTDGHRLAAREISARGRSTGTLEANMPNPAIHLHTLDSGMAAAWAKVFRPGDRLEIIEGDILAGSSDALVSPANSFGYMDGGIDLAYRRFFGMEIQRRVQERIRADHFGELPVGQAIVVATHHPQFQFLVVAPTMRVPDRIADTVNVYLAFRAALLAVIRHNGSSSKTTEKIRVPALGTGVGAVPIDRAARQMHAAHTSVFGDCDWRNDPVQILIQHDNLRS
jgi:O-acetyl-ADP-ribose deacetylase (regulator of RNase III)